MLKRNGNYTHVYNSPKEARPSVRYLHCRECGASYALVHDGSAVEYKIVDRLQEGYQATEMEQWVKEELAHAEP